MTRTRRAFSSMGHARDATRVCTADCVTIGPRGRLPARMTKEVAPRNRQVAKLVSRRMGATV
jgi:hypothetical protein